MSTGTRIKRSRKHRRLSKMRILARKWVNAHRCHGGKTGEVHEKQIGGMGCHCPKLKKRFKAKLMELRKQILLNNLKWSV